MSTDIKQFLIPALGHLLETEASNAALYPYYTGPFALFESSLLEDHKVSADIGALLSILPTSCCTLEIGAGDGRVVAHIKDFCPKLYAVEPSPEGKIALENRFGNEQKLIIVNEAIRDLPHEKFTDVESIIISSLSINLFLENQIDELFEKIDRLLPKGGSFIFGCFHESALEAFSRHNGKVGNSIAFDSFKSKSGENFLMQSFMIYLPDKELFVQNWLLQTHKADGLPPICLSAQAEKIWTLSSLQPYLESWGLKLEAQRDFEILGGGANGQKASMVKCVKQ